MKGRMIALCLVMSLAVPAPILAGMVDDWLTSSSAGAPGYFEGQKRGYVYGGSFSARYPMTADYPVTIQMPKVSSGCGGIDLFGGGFSFLSFDFIVEKLQRMIMGAPAIMFDLAINSLAQQLSSSTKSFEAIINTLNATQLDDCSGSKALVEMTGLGDFSRTGGRMLGDKLKGAVSTVDTKLGSVNSWMEKYREIEGRGNTVDKTEIEKTTQGCPPDILSTFFGDNMGAMLLSSIGTKMGMPAAYTNLLRGLFGDVRVEGSDAGYRVSYIPQCKQNNPRDIDAFIHGDFQEMDVTGTCQMVPDSNRDFYQYNYDLIVRVVNAIKSRTGITDTSVIAYLDSSPVPVFEAAKLAAATAQESVIVNNLAELTAKGMYLRFLYDIQAAALKLTDEGKLAISVTSSTGSPETCQIDTFASDQTSAMEEFRKNLIGAMDDMRASYLASVAQAEQNMSLAKIFRQANEELEAELIRRYGSSTAARL